MAAERSHGARTSGRKLAPFLFVALAILFFSASNSNTFSGMLLGCSFFPTTATAPTLHIAPAPKNDTIDTTPWCPTAHSAADSPCAATHYRNDVCRTCQIRFLIVLTTGRSASTTLMWMLDSLPGVRMSGENNNLMGRLYDLHNNAIQLMMRAGHASWKRNRITESSVSCMVQRVVETINPPLLSVSPMDWNERNTIIGFKTIRLLQNMTGNGSELIDFQAAAQLTKYILRMLPCTRFVVNIRSDTEGQAKSRKRLGWDPNSMEDARSKAEKQNALLTRIANEVLGPERAILLDSSRWTENVTALNEAVAWLGYTPECFFEELLEFNTEGGGVGHNKTKLSPRKPGCRYKYAQSQ